ncbi:hypothetical protein JCM5805K_1374 [Lactococcus lactis subsp. lactis]|uniref:Uncharacterized protein n=1 Tax=Lactococcus lactis subsp. lactis TaxID=1360 RepID=A0A0B8QZB0_LACLL|nr:hypothetical protein JCM5805K_1374 [Lactococcus lactis subsp. lactis]
MTIGESARIYLLEADFFFLVGIFNRDLLVGIDRYFT